MLCHVLEVDTCLLFSGMTWGEGCDYFFFYLPRFPFWCRDECGFTLSSSCERELDSIASFPCSQANWCDWVVAKERGQRWLVHFLDLSLIKQPPYGSPCSLSSYYMDAEDPVEDWSLGDGKATDGRGLGPLMTSWSRGHFLSYPFTTPTGFWWKRKAELSCVNSHEGFGVVCYSGWPTLINEPSSPALSITS